MAAVHRELPEGLGLEELLVEAGVVDEQQQAGLARILAFRDGLGLDVHDLLEGGVVKVGVDEVGVEILFEEAQTPSVLDKTAALGIRRCPSMLCAIWIKTWDLPRLRLPTTAMLTLVPFTLFSGLNFLTISIYFCLYYFVLFLYYIIFVLFF